MLEVLKYKGREGMLAWAFHRLSGLAIFAFLFAHIIEMSMLSYGPGKFEGALNLYRYNILRFAEYGLGLVVLYHALNGTRIALMDIFDSIQVFQKKLFYIQMVLFTLLAIYGFYEMIYKTVIANFIK